LRSPRGCWRCEPPAITGAFHIVVAARHAQYTYLQAAQALTRYVDMHPGGKRLLLSISGDQISVMAGLPAISDEFGVLGLPEPLSDPFIAITAMLSSSRVALLPASCVRLHARLPSNAILRLIPTAELV
jgi:hypothetical protein